MHVLSSTKRAYYVFCFAFYSSWVWTCIHGFCRSLFIQLYSQHSTCVDMLLSAHVAHSFVYNYCIIHIPSQWWNVQHCHQFQTELFHMPRIWLLIIMWIQWLLIPVILVTFCLDLDLDLTLDSVLLEGHGLAWLLCASVRNIRFVGS